jgi:uncharacterized membrane protein YccF (DUF307 family)
VTAHAHARRGRGGIARATNPAMLQLLGNILWFICAGLPLGVGYVLAGVLMCLTVVGIPFGIQAFKLAALAVWPFGQVVVRLPNDTGGLSTIGNILWLVFAGIWLAIGHLAAGVLLCLTIIGIPFGIASMRLAGLALTPFGMTVMTKDEARRLHGRHQLVFGSID